MANWKRKYWKYRKEFKADLYELVKEQKVYIPLIMETYTAFKHRGYIHETWSMIRNYPVFFEEYKANNMIGKMIGGSSEMLNNLAYSEPEIFDKYRRKIPDKLAMGDAMSIAYRVQRESRAIKRKKEKLL